MLSVIFWITLAFILLWIGSGIAVKSISTISSSLRMSSFFISFFVLGVFTSITEIIVGVTSLIEARPEIYIGNLIGSSVIVYLFIIPLLAVVGNGIKLNHSLNFLDIVVVSLIVAFPALLTLDNNFSTIDALICVATYSYTVFLMNKKSNLFEKIFHKKLPRKTIVINIINIVFAVLLVLMGSHLLVQQIPSLGRILHISPFVISVLLVSVGTNIPELSIAIRSLLKKKKEIALGNFLGSAALNTLEIGSLTLLGRRDVPAEGSNFSIAAFAIGLFLFILFMKSKNDISRKEGSILLIIYFLFTLFEIYTGPGWSIR
jgi:cation:H+ antiporter